MCTQTAREYAFVLSVSVSKLLTEEKKSRNVEDSQESEDHMQDITAQICHIHLELQ